MINGAMTSTPSDGRQRAKAGSMLAKRLPGNSKPGVDQTWLSQLINGGHRGKCSRLYLWPEAIKRKIRQLG